MARRKTNAEVGPLGVWAYDTRTALDLSVEGVIDALPTHYHPATLRKIEGGSAVPGTRMWRDRLFRPETWLRVDRHPALVGQPRVEVAEFPRDSDLGALVDAISALVGEMRLARERDQDAAAAMVRAAEALLSVRRPEGDEASTGQPVLRGSAGGRP